MTLCAIIAVLVVVGTGYRSWFALHVDFANFYDAGHKVRAGELNGLYQEGVLIEGKPPQASMYFNSTPLSAFLYVPLSLMRPEIAVIVFRAVCTALMFFGLLLLYREYRRFGELTFGSITAFRNAFLIAILLWQPFWNVYLYGGQSTAFVFLLLVLATLWHVRDNYWMATIAICLACSIKPAMAAFLVFMIVFAWRAYAARTAIVGAALLAISLVTMGSAVHVDFFERRILHPMPVETAAYWLWNCGLLSSVDSLFAATGEPVSRATRSAIGAVVRVIAGGTFIWLFIRSWRKIVRADVRRYFESVSAMIWAFLVIPIIWDHYLALLFIPVVFWLSAQGDFSKNGRILLLAIFALVLGQNTQFALTLNDVLRPTSVIELFGLGLFRSLPIMLIFGFYAINRERIIASYQAAIERVPANV